MIKYAQDGLCHLRGLEDTMNTLSNGIHLIPRSTVQGLCLDNNEREERVNSYLANTANGDVVEFTDKPR